MKKYAIKDLFKHFLVLFVPSCPPPDFFDFTIVANVCKTKSPNFEKNVKSSPHFNADLVWQPF